MRASFSDGLLNERDAVSEWARRDVGEPEAEFAVGLLVDALEGERVREANPPGGGRPHEALVPDKEDRLRVAALGQHAVNLVRERMRRGEAQIAAQRQRAHRRTVEEDGAAIRPAQGAFASPPLQGDDLVDEAGLFPTAHRARVRSQ